MSPVATNGTFRCSEWSFFNIYITDILLLSPHVAITCPPLKLLKNAESHGKKTIKNHVPQLAEWAVHRYRWRTIIDLPRLRRGAHNKSENTLNALENILPVIDSHDVGPIDVQLVALKIDFKAQNVIGANYSPSYWKFSPLFNGGCIIGRNWCKLSSKTCTRKFSGYFLYVVKIHLLPN